MVKFAERNFWAGGGERFRNNLERCKSSPPNTGICVPRIAIAHLFIGTTGFKYSIVKELFTAVSHSRYASPCHPSAAPLCFVGMKRVFSDDTMVTGREVLRGNELRSACGSDAPACEQHRLFSNW